MTDPVSPEPLNSAQPGSLFRSVDVAVFAGAILQRLRAVGVDVGPTAANRLAMAIDCCPPTAVNTLYWLTKTTLLNDRRDFAAFDELFEALFGGIGLPIAPWDRAIGRATVKTEGSLLRQSSPTDGFAAMNARISRERPEVVGDEPSDRDPDDDDSLIPELLPSTFADHLDTPFDQLDAAQLQAIGRWLEKALTDLPTRMTRRQRPSPNGSVDLRRTMRSARSTGEVMTLVRKRQKQQPRPLLMLADVSGSMESFTRVYLHLMRALVSAGSKQSLSGAEVFTFATSLRRVTVQLRQRDPEAAIQRLSDEVSDRFGGTRIAASVGQLISSPRWSHAVRGATVIIASDGWDTEPGPELARRMARLQRLSYRIIWINPRSAAGDYEPAVSGMAAALPYVDEFLSGHSLRSMHEVINALADG
ncbi:MAG: vWA domain-containing protein [Acidimicrobiales bacterium]